MTSGPEPVPIAQMVEREVVGSNEAAPYQRR